MRLPDALHKAIQDEAEKVGSAEISRAALQLSERYRKSEFARAPLDSAAARVAYLQARMPATFAANARVLREVAGIGGIRSMLDLGAGPGTSMWAAEQVFPQVERFTLVERDRELAEVGRRLAWHSTDNAVRAAHWDHRDLTELSEVEPHDLVVASYVLGELSSAAAEQLLRIAWAKAAKLLVVIEPGTPRNFANVLLARNLLIQTGAHSAAPCPHSDTCPMAAAGDWCHFSERLERTAQHRRLKSGALGYEDEKFSYFAASRFPADLPQARIVRHPLKHKGHVQLTLCTGGGLQRRTITKSEKPLYKKARNSEWGDSWAEAEGRFGDTLPPR